MPAPLTMPVPVVLSVGIDVSSASVEGAAALSLTTGALHVDAATTSITTAASAGPLAVLQIMLLVLPLAGVIQSPMAKVFGLRRLSLQRLFHLVLAALVCPD